MLKLCDIVKDYPTATTTVHALRGVSLSFRESEFVAILGPSGCGKTTMLNIIGGLDRYTSGDLIIGGVSTANFDDEHWDSYRNATIGFVFQSYNLIPHLTVLENVELALSLIGEKKKIRRAKAIDALKSVNMQDEINKRPNQLSGGQMQRVAIARAIVNNPKIILADEPTGALDSELSVQVMDILKEISKTRLVIMVTHNSELASTYCSRICSFKDGQLVDDTNPYIVEDDALQQNDIIDNINTLSIQNDDINPQNIYNADNNIDDKVEGEYKDLKNKYLSNRKRKREMEHIDSARRARLAKLGINRTKKSRKDKAFKPTSMSAGMAFSLSMRNLVSKRKRTFFTAFAGSIGVIGLALVLSISNGFDIFVENMQTEMLAGVPLGIYQYNINDNAIMDMFLQLADKDDVGELPDSDEIDVVKGGETNSLGFISSVMESFFEGVSRNEITAEFADYLLEMPRDYYSSMSIFYGTRYNLINKTFDEYGVAEYRDVSQVPSATKSIDIATTVLGENGLQAANWQIAVGGEEEMMESYEFIGENSRYPQNKNEILLCVSQYNQVSTALLDAFGIVRYQLDDNGNPVIGDDGKPITVNKFSADYFIGKKIKLVSNNDYYEQDEDGSFVRPDKYSSLGWAYTNQEKLENMYNNGEDLEIVGVVRQKLGGTHFVGSAIIYTQELANFVTAQAYESDIAVAQRELNIQYANSPNAVKNRGVSVFGDIYEDDDVMDDDSLTAVLGSSLRWSSYLMSVGASKDPSYITIYPDTFSQKEKISQYIAYWRDATNTTIGYFDVSSMFVYNLQIIIDLVSVLLVAVASIALVVSTVMIGVITSNSVIERTREIGILRSIGARKMDIRHVFIAETSIIGLASGLMGIIIAYIFCPIISAIINLVVGVPNLLHFHPLHAFLLVSLSLVLTVISGIIPAINASRKNVVDALRVE